MGPPEAIATGLPPVPQCAPSVTTSIRTGRHGGTQSCSQALGASKARDATFRSQILPTSNNAGHPITAGVTYEHRDIQESCIIVDNPACVALPRDSR